MDTNPAIELDKVRHSVTYALVALLRINPPHNRAWLGQVAEAEDRLVEALTWLDGRIPPPQPFAVRDELIRKLQRP